MAPDDVLSSVKLFAVVCEMVGASLTVETLGSCVAVAVELSPSVTVTVYAGNSLPALTLAAPASVNVTVAVPELS